MRELLDNITGNAALESLNRVKWEARVTENSPTNTVEIQQVTGNPLRSDEGFEVEKLTSAKDLPTSSTDSIAHISHCMRHHVALAKRVEYLKDYIEQCKQLDEKLRTSTPELVRDVDNRCGWPAPTAEPELRQSCGLQLQNEELQLFEEGSDAKALEDTLHRLETLQHTAGFSKQFGELLESQMQRVKQIQALLISNGINNEGCVRVLRSLLKQMQQIFKQQSVGDLLHEIDERCSKMEGRIEQSIKERQRCEDSGSVLSVERELNRQMDLQRRLLDFIREKLDIVSHKAEETETLTTLDTICEETLNEVNTTMEARNQLATTCTRDHDAITSAIAERDPETEKLQKRLIQNGAEFSVFIAENDAALNKEWANMLTASKEISNLQHKRLEAVQGRVAEIMEVKRQEKETELFLWAARTRADQLLEVGRKCKVSVTVCQMIVDFISEARSKLQLWSKESLSELDEKRMTLHKDFYSRFRDWYLTHGEYTHKKKMLLLDVRRKITDTTTLKRMAVQRLDASAEQHGEMLMKLESQRKELEEMQIPRLEDIARTSLPLFEPTKQYLVNTGTPFIHPECDLQQRNEKREAEVHMSEVNKYQELLIKSQQSLLECSNTVSFGDKVHLLNNNKYIVEQHSKLTTMVQSENDISKKRITALKEENKKLKEQLQMQCILIPLEFLDPITLEIIVDPVKAADGHTYERESIEKWFSRKKISPKTNEVVANTELAPNSELADAIHDWKAKIFKELAAAQEDEDTALATETTTTTQENTSGVTTTTTSSTPALANSSPERPTTSTHTTFTSEAMGTPQKPVTDRAQHAHHAAAEQPPLPATSTSSSPSRSSPSNSTAPAPPTGDESPPCPTRDAPTSPVPSAPLEPLTDPVEPTVEPLLPAFESVTAVGSSSPITVTSTPLNLSPSGGGNVGSCLNLSPQSTGTPVDLTTKLSSDAPGSTTGAYNISSETAFNVAEATAVGDASVN
eukprot:TRINITY_DN6948_c0_g1_i1.p1 TRINITY_DN6948_c0_g1~~TRINITY_DN6948_c0_g1_i1.p1  ORF type:complete len:1050 (+),score=160.55 TRINITY_DN6948_c0_g1_i1:228-3152(+)